MFAEKAPSNAPEWSVSDLAGALKRTLEDAFGHVRLRGEVSGYRGPHSSGHAYFCLKDQNARIDAVIWKGTFSRLKIKPEEGMEVIATGRITTFPGSSKYQIVVESLEPAGIGALMALLEERRRKLTAEGLFAAERKRRLPFLPRVIGVVTSPTGAVIRDILHRLEDRFPRRVLVWPVRVQGETCAAEVAAAIRGFNALEPGGRIPRPDVLIVARGGGSIEDLWGFNEEIVVRAAAESAIPLVSAVGHETDCDADRPRRRHARPDADRRRRDGGAGARRAHGGRQRPRPPPRGGGPAPRRAAPLGPARHGPRPAERPRRCSRPSASGSISRPRKPLSGARPQRPRPRGAASQGGAPARPCVAGGQCRPHARPARCGRAAPLQRGLPLHPAARGEA